MNNTLKTLAITFSLIVLLASMTSTTFAAGFVDHKFLLQLPDGKTKELKGAKLHIFHKQHQDGGASAYNNTCYYPDKPVGEVTEWQNKAKEVIGDYHCVTPASCSFVDYGAPYLPNDFDDDRDVYVQPDGKTLGINEPDNASYKAFYGKTFSQALTSDAPFAYLASKYVRGNIRGFEGAKWEASFAANPNPDDKGPVELASQAEIDALNNSPDWGKNIRFIGGTQRWSVGEVYRDPQGGNVLHGQITWKLKAPAAPVTQKPTATFSGACIQGAGLPSYTYNYSNIDLKGQEFSYARVFLRLKHDASEPAIIAALGEPFFSNTSPNGGSYGYSLKLFTTTPTTYVINKDTPIIGKDGATKLTLGQFITNHRSKLPADYRFDIAATLESKSGDTRTLNDYIKADFQPKFINNECGQAPTVLQCLDIKILDSGSNVIDGKSLQPNQKVKFQCGQVAGVTQYKFRVLELNAAGQIGKTVDLQQYPGRVSVDYTIPQAGKFVAQCAICPNGQCQPFENTGRSTGQPNPPAPVPPAGSAGSCVDNGYACITTGGCNTSLGWKNMPQYSCPTGQGCCALQ